MNVLTLCGMAVISITALAVIRELRPSVAPVCAAAAGTVILGYLLSSSAPVISFLKQLDGITAGGIAVMIKALGVAVCCQLTADICRDCGECSSAARVELAGKIGILLLSLPLIADIVKIAGELTR